MDKLHKYANELFIGGKYEQANDIYTQLLDSQYKLDIMYSNKSACFLTLKNYKNALENALNSVQINLNNSIAWGRVGYSYKGLKMFTESLNAFEIAHKLNKNNNNYLRELIFLHKRFNEKINITNVFNLLLNNKTVFNKLTHMKSEIITTSTEKCIDNDNIKTLIYEVMNKL